MGVISILITVKLHFSALPRVMYLVSHRNESTEVLDGRFGPRRWILVTSSTTGSSPFPAAISPAGLAFSIFSLFCLFTDTPAPSPVSELASLPLCSPRCSPRREETSETSYGVLCIFTSAVSFTKNAFSQPLSYPNLHVLSILVAHRHHVLEAFPPSQLKGISLCSEAPQHSACLPPGN